MKIFYYIFALALLTLCMPFISLAQDEVAPVVTGVITGSGAVSVGSTTVLVDTNADGMWTSSNSAIATVSKHGIVTGITTGTATISYAYADASFALVIDVATVTVNPTTNGVNSGDRKACIGSPVIFDISPSIWSINDLSIPAINNNAIYMLTNKVSVHTHTCNNLGFVTR